MNGCGGSRLLKAWLLFRRKLSNSSAVDDELLLPNPIYLFSEGTAGGILSALDLTPILLAPLVAAPVPLLCGYWFSELLAVEFIEEECDGLGRIEDDVAGCDGSWR